jgi:hypothetical protein
MILEKTKKAVIDLYTSYDGERRVGVLHERMPSVVVPPVHENVRSAQRVQIALLVPRTLEELGSTKLHEISQLQHKLIVVYFVHRSGR